MATRPAKDWQNRPSTATPLDAAGLEDLEDRLFGYSEDQLATRDIPVPGASEDGFVPVYDHGTTAYVWTGVATTTTVDDAVAAHSADTTAVHGITDTSTLLTSSSTAGGDVSGTLSNLQLASGVVSATEVNTTLKPSGTAATTDESLRRLGTGSSHAAAGDDSRFPTSGQKNALAGTSGTPGTGNEYATKATTDALQPLDSDLTAIAALTTTAFGRGLLELANQAALLSAAGAAASTHTHAESDVTNLTTDLAGKQPLDSDLTSIAALSTTSFGRSLLTQTDAAATLTTIGAQPVDSDLTSIAALTTTSYGRSFLELADAAAARTLTGAQASDTDLTAIAALTSAADKIPYATGAGTWALTDFTSTARSILDDTSTGAMLTTLSAYSKAEVDTALSVFSGSATQKSTMDAKGDMYAASANDTPAKLAVGTNEHVPIYDSSQTVGLRTGVPLGGLAGFVPLQITPDALRGAGSAGLTRNALNWSSTFFASGAGLASMMSIPIFAADLNLTGRTTKLKVRLKVSTNGTAPAITLTAGLSLISASGGGADAITATWSTEVASSTCSVTTPGANTITSATSSEFDLPADGYYVLVLSTSGSLAATNPRIAAQMSLWMRHA